MIRLCHKDLHFVRMLLNQSSVYLHKIGQTVNDFGKSNLVRALPLLHNVEFQAGCDNERHTDTQIFKFSSFGMYAREVSEALITCSQFKKWSRRKFLMRGPTIVNVASPAHT